jgi:hypothetical protein
MPGHLSCPSCGAVPEVGGDLPPRTIRCRKCRRRYSFVCPDASPLPIAAWGHAARPVASADDDAEPRTDAVKKSGSRALVVCVVGAVLVVVLLVCGAIPVTGIWLWKSGHMSAPQPPIAEAPEGPDAPKPTPVEKGKIAGKAAAGPEGGEKQ